MFREAGRRAFGEAAAAVDGVDVSIAHAISGMFQAAATRVPGRG